MSRSLYIPEGYKSALTLRETQHAIKYIKDVFQQALSFALTLDRVSAPLIVKKGSGINDDLNGVERKVDFTIKEIDGVLGAYDLILNDYGPQRLWGSIHIEVADNMEAAQIDALSRQIQELVYKKHQVILHTVGIYSQNTDETASIAKRAI